jgi:diguanylate cyclase (GGDEF)-like protein
LRSRQNILVVDDSRLIHRVIGARLKDLAVELLYAGDGQAGLTLAHERQPDLILLDVHMPGLTGFDVCRLLKASPLTHDIPVIFLTGSDELVDKVKGFDLGAVDYVVKPFDLAELRARVRAALKTKSLMDLLTSQAQIDGLTGLRNRRYFDQCLAQELDDGHRHGAAVGLLLADVDRFKIINDQFGHPMGDQVVCRFAELLHDACRGSDVPCRFGGDEFAIILPGAGCSQTHDCAERLLAMVRHDSLLQTMLSIPVTASVGAAAALASDHLSPTGLIARADQALYTSKNAGRDRMTVASSSAA